MYEYFIGSFQQFLVIFVRLLGMMSITPFFSSIALKMRFKMALAFYVALMVVPFVVASGLEEPEGLTAFAAQLLTSFIVGLAIGFVVFMMISAFQLSAHIFSMSMGLGMNEVFDPVSQTQTPAMGSVLAIMSLLLFIRMDGHFYMLRAVIDSFSGISILTMDVQRPFIMAFTESLVKIFDIGLRIALPMMGTTLLLDTSMGLISRVAPQFNVMIMGFNIKIIAGFLMFWFLLPVIFDLTVFFLNDMFFSVKYLIRAAGM